MLPSNAPSTDSVHQAASGSTQAADVPISSRGLMLTMMQIAQGRTPVTPSMQSKTGGSIPALNVPEGSGGPKETVQSDWASASASRFSPAIHGPPSESSLLVQRPPADASTPPIPVMHPRIL